MKSTGTVRSWEKAHALQRAAPWPNDAHCALHSLTLHFIASTYPTTYLLIFQLCRSISSYQWLAFFKYKTYRLSVNYCDRCRDEKFFIQESNLQISAAQTRFLQVGILPCGFCSQSETCSTQLVVKKDGAQTILWSCQYHYEGMNYKAALWTSKSTPCTNIPIDCTLCPVSHAGDAQTMWKYNMPYHLLTEHTVFEASGTYRLPFTPANLMLVMFKWVFRPQLQPCLMWDVLGDPQEIHASPFSSQFSC